MPYIAGESLRGYLADLDHPGRQVQNVGELNFVFTQAALKWAATEHPPQPLSFILVDIARDYCDRGTGLNYNKINDVLGALLAAQFEYRRRRNTNDLDPSFRMAQADFYANVAVPYENEKIKQNGDISEYTIAAEAAA